MNENFSLAAPSSLRYTPENWYWFIGTDADNVWSSKRAMSVPVTDQEYLDWVAAGYAAPTIASMDELEQMLSVQYPPGTLKTYNNFKRWAKEQGGITLTSGMPIETNDRAQAKITGVYAAQQVNPAVTTPWHAADGTIWQLDAAAIDAMNRELLTHINNGFSISADVLAGIAAGTITTREQIDDAFRAPMTQAAKDWLKK